MVAPEFVVDAVEAGLDGATGPAWYEVYVDEAAKEVSMVRHDDLQELFGWRVSAGCWAVAVVAGGRARSLAEPGEGPPADVPTGRARVVLAVDRTGAGASRTTLSDGTTLEGGCQGGRLLDAVQRTLGLPTAPAPAGTGRLLADLWLTAVAEAAEAASVPLGWDAVADLHPAVHAVNALQEEALGEEERDALIALTPRVWTWDRLREDTARGAGIAGVPPELAAWMDDGMFARWALEAGPGGDELWGILALGLADDAAGRLADALAEEQGARMSGAPDGYGTAHA